MTRNRPSIPMQGVVRSGVRAGFTLLESMVAVVLLGTIMLAVVAALSASQKVAFEGQKRILAAIACDDLMSELATLSYDDLKLKDGTVEPVGEMQTLDGSPYPSSFWTIGRTTTVEPMTMTDSDSGASVEGVLVTVAGMDDAITLIQVQLFVPDPNPPDSGDSGDTGDTGGTSGSGETGGTLIGGSGTLIGGNP